MGRQLRSVSFLVQEKTSSLQSSYSNQSSYLDVTNDHDKESKTTQSKKGIGNVTSRNNLPPVAHYTEQTNNSVFGKKHHAV